MKHTAYIGLGSNLGDREANIREALRLLDEHSAVRIVRVSPLYATAALANERPSGDPDFLNGVAQIETALAPHALLETLQEIERTLGRPSPHPKDAPRTIDLDILLYDAAVLQDEILAIPHPGLAKRVFVLQPLCDIAPALSVPGTGETVARLLGAAKQASPTQRVEAKNR